MTAGIDTAAARRIRRWRIASRILPLLVLALSFAVSWQLRERARRDIEAVIQADFDLRVRETAGILRERIRACEQMLHAVEGLYAASVTVEPGEFHAFMARLGAARPPGLLGVGFISASGAAASRLMYFEPADPRLAVPGSDSFAEPSRQPAMASARDSGAVAIANKRPLPEEDAAAVQAGYRMYFPVYRRGGHPGAVAERRSALIGWAFAAFSTEGLLDNILGERNDLAIDVYDGNDMADETLLFDTSQDRVGGESELKLLRVVAPVDVGGYGWTLSAKALPNFATPLAMSDLRLITRFGVFVSLLLAGLAWLVTSRRVRDLAAQEELRDAKLRAEEANAAKSRFLAAASHDLRQPIHSQGLFLDVLNSTDLSPSQRDIVGNVRAATDAASEMLNTLLDFSRIEAGVVQPEVRPFRLQPLLARIEREMAPQAAAKGLRLHARATDATVLSDPALVDLIARNLVTNAIRYTERGGVLIGCRTRGFDTWLEVWDTGIGIPPEQQKEVFREFHQLGNPERDRHKGLGLGLAIADGLARRLGHAFWVDSRPGRGSVFRLSLPFSAEAVMPEPAETARKTARLRGRRVLVIDDETAVAEGMRRLLHGWGCDCVAVGSVEEALATAQEWQPDIIVSDYRLRGTQTGADVVLALRERTGVNVPAVLITGDTGPERLREASAHGIPLLHKPVPPERLYRMMAELAAD